MLATALRQTEIAGVPFEYFEPRILANIDAQRERGAPPGASLMGAVEWLDYVQSNRVSANGVFGATIHWPDMRKLILALSGKDTRDFKPTDHPVHALQAAIPNLRFIRLSRSNKVAQAISHYVAQMTGEWFLKSTDANRPRSRDKDIPYDFAKIDELLAYTKRADRSWHSFLAPVSDLTLELTYEELCSDYQGAIVRVLNHLDIRLSARIEENKFVKQADTRSIELERLFREEKGVRDPTWNSDMETRQEHETATAKGPRPAGAPENCAGQVCAHSPGRLAKVNKSYLICSAPRTGSNLLATALRRTGVAGRPMEFFADEIFTDPQHQSKMGVPPAEIVKEWGAWLDYIAGKFITSNGIFGATVHWWHLDRLLSLVAQAKPMLASSRMSAGDLQAFFPGLRFIWLRRVNKAAEAVSHYRARHSGVWQIFAEDGRPGSAANVDVPYNFAEIDKLAGNAMRADDGWRDFLRPVSDQTLDLTYEELNSDYERAIRKVLKHLNVSSMKPIPPPPYLKQADSRSLELEQTYRREKAECDPEWQCASEQALAATRGDSPRESTAKHKRICFITTEFHGLFRNGGIGTANTSLAMALVGAGHHVTVAYANADEKGPRTKEGNFDALLEHYAACGITLDFTPPALSAAKGFDDQRSASYSVYRYLRRHEFDIVLFNDNGGLGYYSLLAKHTGVFPSAPLMFVVAHGPLEWVRELNAIAYSRRGEIAITYLERRGIELADVAISPSRYLADWMVAHGWAMPANMHVMQNIVQVASPADGSDRRAVSGKVDEIVFFGRLEVRKGLELFCDAVDLLEKSRDLDGVQITFMGKFEKIAGLHSGIYVLERSRLWKSHVRLIVTYDQQQALDYLGRDGALAVIPSLAENSPCVVSECLQLGIPFIATGTGGTPELVAQEDREHCLFDPTPAALKEKLRVALESGQRPARIAVPQADVVQAWLSLVENCSQAGCDDGPPGSTGAAERVPLVSVCLVITEQNAATSACLDSILNQHGVRIEVVVARHEDGNLDLGQLGGEAGARITFKHVVVGTPLDHAAARNIAAAQAEGDYLLFVDTQNVVLVPGCVAAFVKAAEGTGADILTAIPMLLDGTGVPAAENGHCLPYLPLGAFPELGAFENCFGEGAIFVRRQSFIARDGFEATDDRSFEDWLFLATAASAGLRVELVPEPLFWSRSRSDGEIGQSDGVRDHRRILEAFGGRPLSEFCKMTESLLDVHTRNRVRLPEMLAPFGERAAKLAMTLSNPGKLGALEMRRKFFEYCLERGRRREAIDFVQVNDPASLQEALNEAAETPISDEVRASGVLLTDASGVSFPVFRPGKKMLLHPIVGRTSLVRFAKALPPGTRSVRCQYSIEHAKSHDIEFGIWLKPSSAPAADESALTQTGVFSGWMRVQDRFTLHDATLALPHVADEEYDLYLGTRVLDQPNVNCCHARWHEIFYRK